MVFGHIRRGVSGKGFQAVSEEGSSFFIPSAVAEKHHLTIGQAITEDEYSFLEEASALRVVKTKAFELLSMREHSTQELRTKLKRREYAEHIIDQVIEDLHDQHLLDDQRFAEVFVRSRSRRRPISRNMLIAELRKRGVSSEEAQEAMASEGFDEQEMLLRALEVFSRQGEDEKKFIARLVRKGFSYPMIRRALESSE